MHWIFLHFGMVEFPPLFLAFSFSMNLNLSKVWRSVKMSYIDGTEVGSIVVSIYMEVRIKFCRWFYKRPWLSMPVTENASLLVFSSLGRSILSKVQKMFVPGCFPIHMDPLTSPSEKNSKKIDTSYWSKQAEVLLYDVVYSDFSPIT